MNIIATQRCVACVTSTACGSRAAGRTRAGRAGNMQPHILDNPVDSVGVGRSQSTQYPLFKVCQLFRRYCAICRILYLRIVVTTPHSLINTYVLFDWLCCFLKRNILTQAGQVVPCTKLGQQLLPYRPWPLSPHHASSPKPQESPNIFITISPC